MEPASVKILDPSQLPADQDRSFQNLMGAIERSKIEVPELSAAALRDVLKGVITGEGPTVTGRVHFSRTLDPDDAFAVRPDPDGGGRQIRCAGYPT
jgi:hypothetical protein